MRVNFLGASDGTPLSKAFEEIAPGTYRETSYPNVAKFSSIERDVSSLQEFHDHVVACSSEGLCLLKGTLDRPLLDESRASHTDSTTPTAWICLDIDYTVTDMTPSEFLDMLSIKDVDYLFQKSASMGIKHHEGWRGHFFILLDSPQSPQALKQWLIARNLSCTTLFRNIGLSASGGALIYPLDTTTCQNDKLLYISPPNCKNFDDPLTDRYELVTRKHRTWKTVFAINAAANQVAVKKAVAKLRDDAGLEKKNFKVTQYHGHELLSNPDPVTVTSKKQERGFVYLNLNGGDSWAYYFPEDRPEIVFNFKGEPCVRLQDVDPDVYNEYKAQAESVVRATVSGAVPFGFLWPVDDTYYRGFANPDTGELAWMHAVGSKEKLRDFFQQNGIEAKQKFVVDEWDMEFDPSKEGRVDFTTQQINTYKQSTYMCDATVGTNIPPIIDRVLTSVCVNEETKNHFINWLASIFQNKHKTHTAWVLQGVQGTGKGVLLTNIITPLMGEDYCHEMTMDRLHDDFNQYLSENFILFIDEADISDSKDGNRLLNRIKNLITEPKQHIRGMRRNAVVRENYSNIILASNHDEIISMEISDRRFNVAPRQEKSIQLNYDDIASIKSELQDFANFLHSYQVDAQQVQTVLLSQARDDLIALSATTIDLFFRAAKEGNLAYFTQYLDGNRKVDIDGIRYHDFADIVHQWVSAVNAPSNVSRTDLQACYQFLQNTQISPAKFSRMANKYGLGIKNVRIGERVVKGFSVTWMLAPDDFPTDVPRPKLHTI